MTGNSFGRFFQIHTFGESHGAALGVVIDGCPAGVKFDHNLLIADLERRRPGFRTGVSSRKESDAPEILSGIFENQTLGTPIAVIVRNQDAKSEDYAEIEKAPRPGHADDVWKMKFGISDHRGGGRSSGRETVARVIGGAFAKMFLYQVSSKTSFETFATKMGPLDLKSPGEHESAEVQNFLLQAKATGESYGGVVECRVKNPAASLGEPVFAKLKSELAAAVLSIGATTFFELGDGRLALDLPGTEFHLDQNHYGGIRGGISTGEDIVVRVGFKPTSSILDVAKKGRHDPCIVPRAVPVVEAMVALVIADLTLSARLNRV